MARTIYQGGSAATDVAPPWLVRTAKWSIGTVASFLPARWAITNRLERIASPRGPGVNAVALGDLRRLSPLSRIYGWDRGQPIDRHYIENFLSAHRDRIRGHVLEISESTYTEKFGGSRVTKSDVLHYNDPSPPVTMIGDLTDAPHIPSNTFDCVIITQTLMLIYDYGAAIETLQRILKPGGTVLCTVAGLTQIADPRWRHTWYWGFTHASAQRIFEDVFKGGRVESRCYGNVLSTTAFLQGMAVEELTRKELDESDPDYQMLIGVAAVKAGTPEAGSA